MPNMENKNPIRHKRMNKRPSKVMIVIRIVNFTFKKQGWVFFFFTHVEKFLA